MGEGDIEGQVYDKVWLLSKFIMRFHGQGPSQGLGLVFENGVQVGNGY